MSIDSLFNALLLVVAVYVYASLLRQIHARPVTELPDNRKTFALPDAILAAVIFSWFSLNFVAASASRATPHFRSRDLVLTAAFSLGLLLFIATFLRFRGRDVLSLGGFSHIGFGRVLSTAAVLLFAAYPLILVSETLAQRFAGWGSSKQEIIEMFNGSQTIGQRVAIIVLAVALAPLAEEFLFRFFLYGVLRRYFGRSVGLIANSFLFAAVHMHLPSLVPLFVLGSCFTIAYEWSGSILVSMTMHALFNSLSLTALAFPEVLPQ